MYFNNNSSGTNIDNQLEKNKNNGFKISKIWIIGLVVLIIIIGICCFLLFFNKKLEYSLILNGGKDIVVYQYEEYVEEGYKAYDNKGNEYNDEVKITGEVNTTVTGEYQIKYQYRDKEVIRVVTVLPLVESETFLILKGESTMFLNVGDSYVEPGFTVLDTINEYSNEEVTVTGQVDTSKVGTYKLVYKLIDKNNISIIKERTVIVIGSNINVSYSPTSFTNGKVTIYLTVKDNYFDYVVLPDGSKRSDRNITYEVLKNGNYKFKIYTKTGNNKEEVIVINNIDSSKPNGSCSGYYLENKTYVTVNAKDNSSGINKYVIDGKEFKKNVITLDGEIKNVTVSIYDNVGNSNNVSCQLTDKNPVTNKCNDKTIYPGHKYVFTQAQREKMAAMVYTEADGSNDLLGMKLVASHMCNYYEKLYKGKEWTGAGLHKLITTSGWYAEMTKKSVYNSSKAIALRAVEEVMEKGNRILPHYIDEFDWFPNDIRNPLNRDAYIQGETTYINKGGLRATFWCINYIEESKSGNIFGYTKKTS